MATSIARGKMLKTQALTVKEVKALVVPGDHCLGGVPGLYLRIAKQTGNKYYLFRYTSPSGKRSFLSLGRAEGKSLAWARSEAFRLSELVSQGIDPADQRRQQRAARRAASSPLPVKNRFFQVAEAWLDSRVKSGYYEKNARGVSVVQSYLDRRILPVIGQIPIDELKPQDVYECLKPLWVTTTEAKNKCRTIISSVFKWAQASGMTDKQNPADMRGPLGVLLENLSPHVKQPRNYGSLAPEDVPDFFSALLEWNTVTSLCFAFTILTAARSKQVRTARWSDIDLEAKTWRCPEEAMKVKGRGSFTVFLSDAAVDLLKKVTPFVGNDLVFASPFTGKPLTDMAVSSLVKKMNQQAEKEGRAPWLDKRQTEQLGTPIRITVHGSRASFMTWTRTGENLKRFDSKAVEMCLAHSVDDGYGGAYDRAELVEERRKIMEAWGDFCTSRLR